MRIFLLFAGTLLAGCASNPFVAQSSLEQCSAQVASLNAQLTAQSAERERAGRAAARREETLRRQLEAMKAIERGILEREDRVRSETR